MVYISFALWISQPTSQERLVVQLNASGERFVEEVTNYSLVLGKKATASRSNSLTKRSRIVADLDEDVEYSSKRLRRYEAKSNESSFDSTLPTLEDDSDFERRPSYTINNSGSAIHSKNAIIPANGLDCTSRLVGLESR